VADGCFVQGAEAAEAAGCGADAAPYFRIFNPVLQGVKFDPDGAYVRRWLPELANLPNRWIHQPWNMPPPERQRIGLHLGQTYPKPIVNHATARQEALSAFHLLKMSRYAATKLPIRLPGEG